MKLGTGHVLGLGAKSGKSLKNNDVLDTESLNE